jgi:uncharacterized repeat protein (TIGR01451 family)
MRIFNKIPVVALAFAFTFVLVGSSRAATSPSFGAAATYGIYAGNAYVNSSATTTINGDVGFSTTPAIDPLPSPRPSATYPNYGPGGNYSTAGANFATALTNLNNQGCTFTFTTGAVVLSTNVQHGSSTYTPGVYCIDGAVSVGVGGITLNGAGTYIFRTISAGTLDAEDSSVVTLTGADACNVFWTPNGAATIGANATFVGTVIPTSQPITALANSSWTGRALSFSDVTTGNGVTVTAPLACVATPIPSGGYSPPLAAGPAQVPPLISVLKVPTPLALPAGPGSVTYDYAVSNIGTVPMSNIKVTDNKCVAISYISGDANYDSRLDINEIWKYQCVSTLSQTTSNIVTATGEAFGLTATDTANATVVVGVPIIPPLINIVKVPNTFVLPAGGGVVTYTYTITNPGTAPLSNVGVTDDKCTGLPGRVVGHPGDLNKNDLLESNETWTFTCRTNIAQTTTNTGTAEGSANGLTAVDFARATVVVNPAVVTAPTVIPKLPKTGIASEGSNQSWNIVLPAGIFISSLIFYVIRKKYTL